MSLGGKLASWKSSIRTHSSSRGQIPGAGNREWGMWNGEQGPEIGDQGPGIRDQGWDHIPENECRC